MVPLDALFTAPKHLNFSQPSTLHPNLSQASPFVSPHLLLTPPPNLQSVFLLGHRSPLPQSSPRWPAFPALEGHPRNCSRSWRKRTSGRFSLEHLPVLGRSAPMVTLTSVGSQFCDPGGFNFTGIQKESSWPLLETRCCSS